MKLPQIDNIKQRRGQAMVEYIVCAIFLGMFVWYALVGGSVDSATGKGGYWEEDVDHRGTGHLLDRAYGDGSNPEMQGLVQALHKKQADFTNSIYSP